MSLMVETLDAFGRAMAEAEKHRRRLRDTFGLSDHQIGTMTLARRKTPRSAMSQYAAAVLDAKRKLEIRKSKQQTEGI
jgi:hypothetical protein